MASEAPSARYSPNPAINATGSTRAQTYSTRCQNSIHGSAKGAIKEISCAENKREAIKAIEEFAREFGVKWPKAVAKIVEEKEALLTFYEFPSEH